jgi:hypothetical protein
MILLLIAMPSDFPYQGDHPNNPWKETTFFSRKSLKTFDFLGVFLLLVASLLLILAVDEAGGIDYQWSSPLVITFLIFSVLLWIIFLGWEVYLSTRESGQQQPVFPWQLLKDRVFFGMLR